jgi:hypothetical protein
MGVAIATRRPNFPVLFLVEGGVDRFTDDVSRTFAGGKAVCYCAQAGKTARKRARSRALASGRVVDASNLAIATMDRSPTV